MDDFISSHAGRSKTPVSKGLLKTGFSGRKIRLLLAEKILPAADADHALSISGSKFPVVY